MSAVELDDTSRCPLGHRCESCGIESADLAVTTVVLDVLGVACLTLCPRCAGSTWRRRCRSARPSDWARSTACISG